MRRVCCSLITGRSGARPISDAVTVAALAAGAAAVSAAARRRLFVAGFGTLSAVAAATVLCCGDDTRHSTTRSDRTGAATPEAASGRGTHFEGTQPNRTPSSLRKAQIRSDVQQVRGDWISPDEPHGSDYEDDNRVSADARSSIQLQRGDWVF
jgi:hypothetical protein